MACVIDAKVTISIGLEDGLTCQRKAEIATLTRLIAITCVTNTTMLRVAGFTIEH